jgi:DNA-directed RNA polymerase specialized sigma24 family protein
MSVQQSSPAARPEQFRTTRWSEVLISAQSQAPGCQQALAELSNRYWYPLYAFVRRRGSSPEHAQDLVQGFFLHLLEHKMLSRVDRSKGKFRSFLLASLQNYVSNEAGRARCLKRGGGVNCISLDLAGAEDRYSLEPVDALTPGKVFVARWALALLGEAMNRLRMEYVAQGKSITFEALKAFLDPINSKKLPSYEDAANQLKISVAATKTTVHRLRKRYTAFVREEVARTVSNIADLDAEVHALRSVDCGGRTAHAVKSGA